MDRRKWPAHIPLMWDFHHCLRAHRIFQWAVVTSQNKRIIARGRCRQSAWESFRKGRRWCHYFAESCWPSLVHGDGASLKSPISLSWQISPLLKHMVIIATSCKSVITQGNNAGGAVDQAHFWINSGIFFNGIALALFQGCCPARKQLGMVRN